MSLPLLVECYQHALNSGLYSDKGTDHSYIGFYERLFANHQERPVRLLEIGVAYGGSLRMWREYFALGTIWGVDINLGNCPPVIPGVTLIEGDATKAKTFEGIEALDIVIDDGSHLVDEQIATYKVLRKRMAPGGLYVIEDIQSQTAALLIRKEAPFLIVDRRNQKGRYDDVLLVLKT